MSRGGRVLARFVILVAIGELRVRALEFLAAPLLRGPFDQFLQALVVRRANFLRALLVASERGEIDLLLLLDRLLGLQGLLCLNGSLGLPVSDPARQGEEDDYK